MQAAQPAARDAIGSTAKSLRQLFSALFPNPPLARAANPAMVIRMFGLTRNEQAVVIGFVFVFLLGFGVKQWRDSAAAAPVSLQSP